jgi:hypothetical protein
VTFTSSWDADTGTSLRAVTDGGRWDRFFNGINDPNVLSVVPGASVGWTRSRNVLRVMMRGSDNGRAVEVTNAVPASTTHWGRMYFRNDETGQSISAHNFSYNFAAPIQIVFFNRKANPSGPGWVLDVFLGAPYPANIWRAQVNAQTVQTFANGAWYRYEWMIEYLSANTFRFYPRLYDPNGTLIADHRSFYHQDPFPSDQAAGYDTLAEWYALGNRFTAPNVQLMRNLGIGNEGRTPSPNNLQSWYIANFALSTRQWIGP